MHNCKTISKVEEIFDPKSKLTHVVFSNEYTNYDDGYGGTATLRYLGAKGFTSKEDMLAWVHSELTNNRYGAARSADSLTVVELASFNKFNLRTEVSLNVVSASQ